jgi:hypothetical protein
MHLRGLLLCVAMLASGITSASATMFRIIDDRGGKIDHYLQTFAKVRETGQLVVVDGNCLSACTLVLGLVPHDRLCATSRAHFGFHAAWMRNMDGYPIHSAMGTRALWNIYPVSVRRWIEQHGGLSNQMIYMEGRALRGIVATCDRAIQRELLLQQAAGYSGTLAAPHSGNVPIDVEKGGRALPALSR